MISSRRRGNQTGSDVPSPKPTADRRPVRAPLWIALLVALLLRVLALGISGAIVGFILLSGAFFVVGLLLDEQEPWDWPSDRGPACRVLARIALSAMLAAAAVVGILLWVMSILV